MQYFCEQCRMRLESVTRSLGGRERCPGCGHVNTLAAEESDLPMAMPAGAMPDPASQSLGYALTPRTLEVWYAGFWIRLGACLLDWLIMWILSLAGCALYAVAVDMATSATINVWRWQFLVFGLLYLLNNVLLAASPWQASLGKRIASIYVVDCEFNRISFGRALGRCFAPLLLYLPQLFITVLLGVTGWQGGKGEVLLVLLFAGIFYGGYLMAAFHPRKRAFHDFVAGTLVIRGRPDEMLAPVMVELDQDDEAPVVSTGPAGPSVDVSQQA